MTLPSVLDPYSVWVLSHRNTVIVVLGLILFAVACHALIMHWRVESLERDLSRAPERSDRTPVYTPSRQMGAPQPDLEPPPPGGLPPVRGGRTYARNLGSALQKSSAPPAPPIYSPPTPQGWSPNAAAQQPGRPPASPFPSNPAPWGAPVPPPPMGWPPMGPGTTPAGPPLGTYPNQPGAAPAPPGPPPAWPAFPPPMPISAPPHAPGQPGPTPFGTPALPGFPAFGQAAPSPAAAPPPVASAAPGPAPYPPLQAAPVEAPPAEPGKRGKPKRRRFNFSVLEGIEKKIQSLPRAAAPVETPAPPIPAPAPAGMLTPAAPAAPTPVLAPEIAPAESETTAPVDAIPQPAEDVKPAAADGEDAELSVPEPRARSKTGRERRSAMRSMMFGEEPPAPAPPASSTAAEPETAAPAGEPAPAAEGFSVTADLAPTSELTTSEPAAEESTFAFTSRPDDRDADAGAGPPLVAESEPEMSFDPGPSLASETADRPSWATPVGREAFIEAPAHDLGGASAIEPEPSTAAEPETGVTDQADRPAYEPEHEAAGAPVSAEAAEAEGEPPTAAAEADKPAAGTMVIIEDDASVAEYYATLFRGNGYRVEVAHDGVSGVDLCARVLPDVILLDVMMPRQNGILVLQTLRASDETRNTPVVVLSNFSEPTLIKRALQLGALEYVIKTQVEGSALLQAVPRWISREKAFAAA